MGGASPGFDSGEDVAVDPGGNIFVAGYFYRIATFGPVSLVSAGDYDVFAEKLLSGAPGHFGDHAYGSLLFPPLQTTGAEALPEDVYSSASLGMFNGLYDRFFLSSQGALFSPLVVDDAIHINSANSGLGPYSLQPGVPPYFFGAPIERNLQPLPAYDATSFFALGQGTALFELLDTDRVIRGNTAVYLVRDCGIWLDETEAGQVRLNWVSGRVQLEAVPSNLDVVSGRVLDLHADRDFRRACFLGHYPNTTQVVDARTGPPPPPGDGYYYLVSGTCTSQIGYGNSLQGSPPESASRVILPPLLSCQ